MFEDGVELYVLGSSYLYCYYWYEVKKFCCLGGGSWNYVLMLKVGNGELVCWVLKVIVGLILMFVLELIMFVNLMGCLVKLVFLNENVVENVIVGVI